MAGRNASGATGFISVSQRLMRVGQRIWTKVADGNAEAGCWGATSG